MPEYIDRNEIVKKIKEAQNSLQSNDDKKWERNKNYFKGLAWAHRLILDAPTITDVAPVVHGRWRKGVQNWMKEYGFECTACGEIMWNRFEMPFCPNCGAKMDLEEGHE